MMCINCHVTVNNFFLCVLQVPWTSVKIIIPVIINTIIITTVVLI